MQRDLRHLLLFFSLLQMTGSDVMLCEERSKMPTIQDSIVFLCLMQEQQSDRSLEKKP